MKTFEERAKELVSKMTLAEKMSQMKYDAPAIERLGIPAYNWWNEALHGVARSGCSTVFPQAIGAAASFDDELLETEADIISTEARAKYNEYRKFGDTLIYQGLTMWSPNINIFRDPRWGRGHETYGEDPYLTGRMGAAFVRGMQGKGEYHKTDACLKHYAVHSGPEGLRHEFDAVVSDEDLYGTYLEAFRYCIEHSKPASVMGAYNRVNGEAACGSKWLIEDVLRGELGFDGYYLSDCGAIADFNKHHRITKDEAESAALAVNSGCDLNCGSAYAYLKVAYERGLVTEDAITKAVERLFTARFRLGMFDKTEYDNIPYDVIECEEHRKVNLKMAEESVVLLKNDGILPLSPEKSVAVIGPNADDLTVLLGNYNGTPSKYTTFLRGIQEVCNGNVYYARGCSLYESNINYWAEQPYREAVIAAKKADVVVMFMGLNSLMEGEEGDAYNGANSGDKADIELPESQKTFFEKIIALGKPVIFVNVSGSCINLCRQDEACNAVVQCFYPGAEGGRALANILFGKTSPSGRLPVTFYRSTDDLPPFEDYSMENRTYRFFKGTPLYPFGHGLTYSEITETEIDENTAEVENKGEFDTGYSVLRFKDGALRDFKRIFIKPGEKITVKFD